MCSIKKLSRLIVRQKYAGQQPAEARIHIGPLVIQAVVGKHGLARLKREGDRKTPVGSFKLKPGYFRNDRMLRLCCSTGLKLLHRNIGWCDQAWTGLYNRPISAGRTIGHEKLWRDDHIYDVVFPTSHNEKPRVQGAGSAIFFHLARADFTGTEGCIAISANDMRRLLPRLGKNVELVIIG
jgi:L,D-peptidoglycan transpeptidase YkuD (ErfK/YbiS/YcfS/YnhG family)